MTQITLTLDLTPKNLEILQMFTIDNGTFSTPKPKKKTGPLVDFGEMEEMEEEENKKPPVKSKVKSAPKKASKSTKKEPIVTFSDIHALAKKFVDSGNKELLQVIFNTFDINKLSHATEDMYPDLLAALHDAWEEIKHEYN